MLQFIVLKFELHLNKLKLVSKVVESKDNGVLVVELKPCFSEVCMETF